MVEDTSYQIIDLSNQFKSFENIAMFTDIHWGAHHNSIQHNEDCLLFIDWFISQCKSKPVDAIFMLGDWFEHRGAINTLTFKYSLRALRKLNALNIPFIFLVGNHDLYHRHNREVHSAEGFKELQNIHVIEHPSQLNDLLLVPFLFKDEYPLIAPYVNKAKYVFGHFEFRNFYLTGTNTRAEHGYHHKLFDGPKQIFSGHYHKRQANDNVCYIGSPFGTSYADAGDYERGCCFLNTKTNDIDFIDYEGPTYLKTILSQIINGDIVPNQKARIRCLLDVDVSYSEAQSIKSELMEFYDLRELILEENVKEQQTALEESIAELDELDLGALDETVTKLIETGVQGTTTINPSKLAQIYKIL